MAVASFLSSRFGNCYYILRNQAKKVIQYSSYRSSQFLEDIEVKKNYEISNNPEEWNFVERLLPPSTVPEPIKKDSYPSDWKPPSSNPKDMPFYVERTKNHMLPVYLIVKQRGLRKHTLVRKIQGDIFLLEKQLLEFLQKESFMPMRSQVNEFAGYIRINGDYVNATKFWLEQKDL